MKLVLNWTSVPIYSLNHERFENWATQAQKQCIHSYDGPAFKNLQPGNMSTEDLDFANAHVRIISGLYGLLKPCDLIKPYR